MLHYCRVKRSSPSKGVICKNFQPTIIAGTYEAGGAVAISVLTEPHFFGGNITHMTDIRNETQLSILRKDFIVDSYQIVEAKCYGADAILLIAKIHNESTIGALLKETHKRNLVAIVEVHDEADIDKALNAGASIIGINNRNLTTFQTNLDTSLRLAQKIPKDIILISESGINSRQDIESLMKVGIRTFLIGEALMRENEATSKLKMLQGV